MPDNIASCENLSVYQSISIPAVVGIENGQAHIPTHKYTIYKQTDEVELRYFPISADSFESLICWHLVLILWHFRSY